MPNCWTRRRCARAIRISISTTRAFRSAAACCNGAAARRGTTRWCGATRAAPTRAASISCRTARSPASTSPTAACAACAPRAATSRRPRWRSPAPAIPRASRRSPGLRLPIESHVLQAFVSEGVKPLIDGVITFGAGHFYISQSDKGGLVFGGDIDGYNSYAQRGSLPVVEDVMRGRHGDPADARPAARAAPVGRHHGHDHGRLADHRHARRSRASISTPAGAMAASRRRRPPAGASRT